MRTATTSRMATTNGIGTKETADTAADSSEDLVVQGGEPGVSVVLKTEVVVVNSVVVKGVAVAVVTQIVASPKYSSNASTLVIRLKLIKTHQITFSPTFEKSKSKLCVCKTVKS